MTDTTQFLGTEKELEVIMIEWLHMQGHYAVKVHSGKAIVTRGDLQYAIQLAPEGTPDVFACIHGMFVTIEVKKNDKEHRKWDGQWTRFQKSGQWPKSKDVRRSIMQHLEQEKVRAARGATIVCSSLEELQADVRELLSSPPPWPTTKT